MSPDPAVEALVDRVAEILKREIGLRPEATLRGRLRRSIRDEAHTHGQTLDAYVAGLAASPAALQGLFNRVTVQETSFFRHPEHFRVLARDILPTLPQPVTIWSAGCANGQEAYSLAMVLDEYRIEGRVIATDMSTSALHRTESARYNTRETAGITPDRLKRYFTHSHHGWHAKESLRSRVKTLQHNLIDGVPELARPAQVVFCRNVLIYFSSEHAKALVNRVADMMPGAAIFLGSAEAMWPISDRYETVHTGDTFYYRLRPSPVAPDPSPTAAPTRSTPHPRSTSTPTAVARVRHPGTTPDTARRSAPERTVPAPATRQPAQAVSHHPVSQRDADEAAVLARSGQQALDAGDYAQAIAAFRKCAYLVPDDVLAHLHLGLALEASGDMRAARRAFDTARRALLDKDPTHIEPAIGGYATNELLRLLDTKRQVLAP